MILLRIGRGNAPADNAAWPGILPQQRPAEPRRGLPSDDPRWSRLHTPAMKASSQAQHTRATEIRETNRIHHAGHLYMNYKSESRILGGLRYGPKAPYGVQSMRSVLACTHSCKPQR